MNERKEGKITLEGCSRYVVPQARTPFLDASSSALGGFCHPNVTFGHPSSPSLIYSLKFLFFHPLSCCNIVGLVGSLTTKFYLRKGKSSIAWSQVEWINLPS